MVVEEDIKLFVEGLEELEGLDLEIMGDIVVVNVLGGYFVCFCWDGGVWYVEDFD